VLRVFVLFANRRLGDLVVGSVPAAAHANPVGDRNEQHQDSQAEKRFPSSAQRDADYAFNLAVDPPSSKELRLFGLAGWVLERFVSRRTKLHELQHHATRLRERPVVWSLLIVIAALCRSRLRAGLSRPERNRFQVALSTPAGCSPIRSGSDAGAGGRSLGRGRVPAVDGASAMASSEGGCGRVRPGKGATCRA